MSELLHVDLVTPDRRYLSEEVEMVVVPGELGDLGIMANHSPLVSMMRPGMITVHKEKGENRKYFVNGGYANVSTNVCTILAESLIPFDELNISDIDKEIAHLEGELVQADSEAVRASLERRLFEANAKRFILS